MTDEVEQLYQEMEGKRGKLPPTCEGTIVELGTKNLGKGRPLAVYSMTPVSDKLIETAKKEDVVIHESATVNIVDIKDTPVVNTKKEMQTV